MDVCVCVCVCVRLCVCVRACVCIRVCVWGGGHHPQTLTEVKHRPPRIMLGIFRINFTTARIDYWLWAGVDFDMLYGKCLCALFHYLRPVAEIWIIFFGMFCTWVKRSSTPHTPQPHPKKVKKKKKYSTIQNKRKFSISAILKYRINFRV